MIDAILDDIVNDPKLAPLIDRDGKVIVTYCNIAVQRYLNRRMNYHIFDGHTADEICVMLQQQTCWVENEARAVQNAVNNGDVAIAAHPYVHHGHVAIIAPEDVNVTPNRVATISGKWAILCPVVGNVGHTNGYMSANFAFPTTDTAPKYYQFNAQSV